MAENIEELLAFYALEALNEAERLKVEDYLASHPEAKAGLEGSNHVVAALPHDADPLEPSPAVKKRLMERVHADAQTRFGSNGRSHMRHILQPGPGSRLPQVLAALCLLIAIAAGAWALALNREIGQLKTQVAVLQQEVDKTGTVLAHLTAPQSQAFSITGTQQKPGAHGQFIVDTGTGSSILVVSGLEPLAAGQTYEFWLIKDSTAVPSGLFTVDQQGRAILQVPQNSAAPAYNAIGVSIEPQGGSSQPTAGNIVMLGKLN